MQYKILEIEAVLRQQQSTYVDVRWSSVWSESNLFEIWTLGSGFWNMTKKTCIIANFVFLKCIIKRKISL